MHVTLINPPRVSSYEQGFYSGRAGGPPLNLAFLSRIIEDCGHEYSIIDCVADETISALPQSETKILGLPIAETISRINPKTDVIGITAMFTCEFIAVRALANEIKKVFPNVPLILGGEHATTDADAIVKYEPSVDFCFLGEGEDSLRQFLKLLPEGRAKETPGVAFRGSEGEVVRNQRPPRMIKIDDHFPLWDKFPVNFYLDRKMSYSKLGMRSLPILSTRGCPYKCTFCTNEEMWGTRYVMRSVDSILKEMKDGITRYGVEHFEFIDLAVSVNKKWFEELLIRIRKEVPGISWEMTVGTRSEVLDYNILKLMKESGNDKICYAPETGSESMAKKIDKRIKFDKFFQSVRSAVKLELDVRANIIIGFPHETPGELLKTIYLALKLGWLGVKGVNVMRFMPVKGTILTREYFPDRRSTLEAYNYDVETQAGVNHMRVFSPWKIFKEPKEQFYAFIANSCMVLSYFLCVLRRPAYIPQFFRNLSQGTPRCAMEVAAYYMIVKPLQRSLARPVKLNST